MEEEDEVKPPKENKLTTLPDYVKPYRHLFEKKNFDRLPAHTEWDHEINLLPDAPKELKAKVYPMTVKEQEELQGFIKENLESERI